MWAGPSGASSGMLRVASELPELAVTRSSLRNSTPQFTVDNAQGKGRIVFAGRSSPRLSAPAGPQRVALVRLNLFAAAIGDKSKDA